MRGVTMETRGTSVRRAQLQLGWQIGQNANAQEGEWNRQGRQVQDRKHELGQRAPQQEWAAMEREIGDDGIELEG